MVNFPSLAPPLRLCVCTYLALSNWRFGLWVQIHYLFCARPPNPTYQYVTPHLVFGIGRYVKLLFFALKTTYFRVCKSTYFESIFFSFPSYRTICLFNSTTLKFKAKVKSTTQLFKIRSASTCTTIVLYAYRYTRYSSTTT